MVSSELLNIQIQTENEERTYCTGYCGMASNDFTGRLTKLVDSQPRCCKMVIKNYAWLTKYKLNLYQIKQSFSGPLFFKKRDYSLEGQLHNPNCNKSESCIFSKNAMIGK